MAESAFIEEGRDATVAGMREEVGEERWRFVNVGRIYLLYADVQVVRIV
jgi:hypothetical protein